MKPYLYRLHTTTLAIALFLSCLVYSLRAQSDQAHIVIDTDCSSSSVQAYGGGLGYPGPSQLVCKRDEMGTTIHLDLRVFETRRYRTYMAVMLQ